MSEEGKIVWEVSFVTIPDLLVKPELPLDFKKIAEPATKLSGPAIRMECRGLLFAECKFVYLQEAATAEEACRLVKQRALELAPPWDGDEDDFYEFKAIPHDAEKRARDWDEIRKRG